MKNEFIIVLTTASSEAEAEKILGALLNLRLVACGSIINSVRSRYWWKGNINKAREHIVILKTKRNMFKKVCDRINSIHSYDVPEIISIPIENGSRSYFDWIRSCVK